MLPIFWLKPFRLMNGIVLCGDSKPNLKSILHAGRKLCIIYFLCSELAWFLGGAEVYLTMTEICYPNMIYLHHSTHIHFRCAMVEFDAFFPRCCVCVCVCIFARTVERSEMYTLVLNAQKTY